MISIRKKSYKKWIVIAAILILVGGGIWFYFNSNLSPAPDARSAAFNPGDAQTGSEMTGNYTAVTRGNITKTVYGSGNLSSAQSMTVYSGAAGKVEEIYAEAGDIVKKGDVVLKLTSDDLETEIASLAATLFDEQVSLSEIRDSGTTSSIYAPATGRVKLLKAEEDDDVEAVMSQYGYLCMISRDGKMRVEFDPAENAALNVGDFVTVWIDGTGIAGRVIQVIGLQGRVAVTIDDDTYEVGKEVSITSSDSVKLGSGNLEINLPIPVTAVGGTIDKVDYKENSKVTSGNRLFYLTGKTPSTALKKAYLTYEQARINLERAQKKLDSLTIRAPFDGVITEMTAALSAPQGEDSQAFSIQSSDSFELVATVDELDIVGVSVGQQAMVEFDAFPNAEFKATVKRISGLATVSGGVATYEVTLSLTETDGLLDGMTASANIVVADRQGVLLVPVEAVSTSGGKSYVTLANGSTSEIMTGIADETHIEVLSGVSEGDMIRIVRSNASSSGNPFGAMGGGFNMAMPMGSGQGRR